jgi:hypothetical protein
MEQDTLIIDTAGARPLPSWLIKQKEGLNTYQPVPLEMKEDRSLQVSFAVTGMLIVLIVVILTVFILKKKKN